MAKLEANLTVKAGQDKEYLCSMSDNYTEVYQEMAKVDNSDTFVLLASLSKTNFPSSIRLIDVFQFNVICPTVITGKNDQSFSIYF